MDGLPTSPSLARRALLAVALMIGFYLLAITMAFALALVPYLLATSAVGVSMVVGKLAAFCVGAAALILWSLVPRPDRFIPPGPVLAPERHPRLFTLIREVAAATGQAMPATVYLVPDVNAWVAQRGGILGFGSRRVMGLGLPLLQVLKASELRAVLAHEFGHYYAGDTALGPCVYRTRSAIERTLRSLSGPRALLQAPFAWYGRLFLQLSHDVSRRQERAADVLAASTAGPRALSDGLRKLAGAAIAFAPYWSQEVAPILRAGFLPPIAEGFRRFVASEPVRKAVAAELERILRAAIAHPFDSHPPLGERLAVLEEYPAGEPPPDEPPALALVADVVALERALVHAIARLEDGQRAAPVLTPVAWDEVASRVFRPTWDQMARRQGHHVAGLSVDALAERASALAESLAATREGEWYAAGDRQNRQAVGTWMLGAILASALARGSWVVRSQPGEGVVLEGPSAAFAPFALANALAAGEIDAAEWRRRCAAAGITGLSLAP